MALRDGGTGTAIGQGPILTTTFAVLGIASYLSPGYYSYPQDAVLHSRLAAWPALTMAALAAAAGFAATLALAQRFPRLRLVAIFRRVLGGAFGSLAAGAVLAVDLLLAALLLRANGNLIQSMFLSLTPVGFVTLLTVASAAYTAQAGLQALGRALPLMVVIVVVLTVVFLALATKDVRYGWLIFPDAFPLRAGAQDALALIYVFFGFHQLLNIRPGLPAQRQQYVPAIAWAGFGWVALLLGVTMAVVLGALTPQGAHRMLWATATTMRLVRESGFFIARVGLAILAVWSTIAYTYLSVHLWGEATMVCDLAGLPQSHVPWLTWALAATMWALASWAWPNQIAIETFLHRVVDPVGTGLLIGLPILLAVLAAVRRLKPADSMTSAPAARPVGD